MLSVLMMLPIVMYLEASRRFVLYALLLVFQGYTYNQNIPFTVGAIAADLVASGYIKKFNQKSRIAFLLTETALAAFFVAAFCYNPIFINIDQGLQSVTTATGLWIQHHRVYRRSYAELPDYGRRAVLLVGDERGAPVVDR